MCVLKDYKKIHKSYYRAEIKKGKSDKPGLRYKRNKKWSVKCFSLHKFKNIEKLIYRKLQRRTF